MSLSSLSHHWNTAITALTLIRIGQELGTDSTAARAIHDVIELLCAMPWKFLG